MLYRIIALTLLMVFYSFYLGKLVVLKRQNIRTNQIGKGEKSSKVRRTELLMRAAATWTVVLEVLSILLVKEPSVQSIPFLGIPGLAFGVTAILFFACAIISMKNSWRVGIPQEKTAIITNGIYRISRNPAFVGFDLLYLSILLMFFNLPLLLCSGWAAVMLHLQILHEEAWLFKTFPKQYPAYARQVCRYLGRKSGT